jgi:uncharacterized membrane protein HdeD (DUF308 family)
MNTTSFRSRRQKWDWTFIRLLPAVAVAAGIGLLFGNPFDNLIVIAWILPLWLLVRFLVPNTDVYKNGHDAEPSA